MSHQSVQPGEMDHPSQFTKPTNFDNPTAVGRQRTCRQHITGPDVGFDAASGRDLSRVTESASGRPPKLHDGLWTGERRAPGRPDFISLKVGRRAAIGPRGGHKPGFYRRRRRRRRYVPAAGQLQVGRRPTSRSPSIALRAAGRAALSADRRPRGRGRRRRDPREPAFAQLRPVGSISIPFVRRAKLFVSVPRAVCEGRKRLPGRAQTTARTEDRRQRRGERTGDRCEERGPETEARTEDRRQARREDRRQRRGQRTGDRGEDRGPETEARREDGRQRRGERTGDRGEERGPETEAR